jgi:hypothetical protein
MAKNVSGSFRKVRTKEKQAKVDEKLKEPSLSDRQRTMLESERTIANEELTKIETTK